jgi:hypothetical protein
MALRKLTVEPDTLNDDDELFPPPFHKFRLQHARFLPRLYKNLPQAHFSLVRFPKNDLFKSVGPSAYVHII